MDSEGWMKVFETEMKNAERLAQEAVHKLNAMQGSLARAVHAFELLTTPQKQEELPFNAPVIPEWMTTAQVDAIHKLYEQNPDGSATRADFFKRVEPHLGYCGLSWCGMFVGIEKDGYTHT